MTNNAKNLVVGSPAEENSKSIAELAIEILGKVKQPAAGEAAEGTERSDLSDPMEIFFEKRFYNTIFTFFDGDSGAGHAKFLRRVLHNFMCENDEKPEIEKANQKWVMEMVNNITELMVFLPELNERWDDYVKQNPDILTNIRNYE